jgi:DNA-binding winged helix-turn-helix (wHTH) protein/TolB-like protein
MDVPIPSDAFVFGQFRLDRRGGGLFRCAEGGNPAPVNIGSRALDVLGVLIERRGDLVPKDQIIAAVWPGIVVEEANLTVQISTLRRILDAGSDGPSCIQTVSGRGYRFVPRVTRHEEESVAATPAPAADPTEPPSETAPARSRVRSWRWLAAGSGAVAIVVLLMAAMWHGGWLARTPASRPLAYSPEDRRRSMIVLPFENSNGDPAQDAIAAGVSRDVTNRLDGDPEMPLVPAVTAVGYRGRTLDLHAIGHDLDVHFALMGDARRQDEHLLVTATLYDTVNVRPVGSWRFDRPDSPGEQDRIAQAINESVWQSTIDWEAARALREHPDSLDKRDLIFAALATPMSQPTKASFLARISLLDRALALDPNYILALEYEARLRALRVIYGYSSDPAADLAIAAKAADQMLLINPNGLLSLRAKAAVLRAQCNWDAAAAVLRRVIALRPLTGNRHTELGTVLMAQGNHKEALESFLTAKQLAAGSDPVYAIDTYIALELLATERFSEAIPQARLAIGEFPPDSGRWGEAPWLALIAADSESGQDAAARADLQTFLASSRTWSTMTAIEKLPAFAANPKLLEGLRRAGMPTQ